MTDPPSIVCPKCGLRSYHPTDIERRYCGNCHQFHEWMFGPMKDDPFERDYLMCLRAIVTGHVIRWLREGHNAGLVETLREFHAADPTLGGSFPSGQMVRAMVIQSITPEGGFPLEEGPDLGLLCRFIEAATGLVDWDNVANSALENHIDGGK